MEQQIIILVHLLGAIMFVGAITLEVLVLEPIRKHLGEDLFQKVEFYLFRRIRRFYPIGVIPLYLTGFYMYFGYLEPYDGFADFVASPFGLLLTIKMGLALGLLLIFAFAPFFFMGSHGNPLMHFLVVNGGPEDFRIGHFEALHYLAFALSLAIVVTAKLMFVA